MDPLHTNRSHLGTIFILLLFLTSLIQIASSGSVEGPHNDNNNDNQKELDPIGNNNNKNNNSNGLRIIEEFRMESSKYLAKDQFDELVKLYRKKFQWLNGQLATLGNETAYLLMEFLNNQMSISVNNQAIKSFFVERVEQLLLDRYNSPSVLGANSRISQSGQQFDEYSQLMIARAKTRATIQMILANKAFWIELIEMAQQNNDQLSKWINSELNQFTPRDSLDLSEHFHQQLIIYERIYPLLLPNGLNSLSVYKEADELLDKYFQCLDCEQNLIIYGWSCAAPMQHEDQVRTVWRAKYLNAKFLVLFDKICTKVRQDSPTKSINYSSKTNRGGLNEDLDAIIAFQKRALSKVKEISRNDIGL